MIKAVIFDAYGTLINTKDGSVKAVKAILKKNNFNTDATKFYSKWKKYHRIHIDSITSFIKEEELFLMDLKKLYVEYNINGNPDEDVKFMLATLGIRDVFDDTLDTINKLREKYKVYIGSTTDEAPLLSDIKKNNIKIDGCFTSEGIKVYKPKREFFEKILDEIDVEPHEAVYVGDSQIDDLLGASSAGIKAIWINRKKQVLDENIPKPYYEIKCLSELLNIL